jgi:cellulose synthase/poly-beta-1,6-N-acetylglucosamine synthase-like glycosyltransferase
MIMTEVKNLKFSIVIPTYNEEDYIENCVNSILIQEYDQSLIEILIVDGNSTDSTRNIVQELIRKNENIRLLDNPVSKTPHALNIGAKNSSGDVVIILGAHTEIDKNFVKYNNQFLQEKGVKVTGGTQENVGTTYIQKLIGKVMQMPFAMGSANYRWSKKEQFVDTVVYAAYRRELFDELGYFEENFTISEDAEFNWRIRNAGHRIFYSPKIKSYYYPRSSLKRFFKQIFRYGILRVNVLKKHINSIKLLHIIPPLFVISIVSILILSLFYPVFWNVIFLFLAAYFLVSFLSVIFNPIVKSIDLYLLLPLLIFVMHFSWGLGFLIGLILPKSDKW